MLVAVDRVPPAYEATELPKAMLPTGMVLAIAEVAVRASPKTVVSNVVCNAFILKVPPYLNKCSKIFMLI
jgi:hypothetical protein